MRSANVRASICPFVPEICPVFPIVFPDALRIGGAEEEGSVKPARAKGEAGDISADPGQVERVRSTQDSATAAGLAAGADARDTKTEKPGAARRARQMIGRLVGMHGGRVQRG